MFMFNLVLPIKCYDKYEHVCSTLNCNRDGAVDITIVINNIIIYIFDNCNFKFQGLVVGGGGAW
jgi:hypothetical protein